MRRRSPLRGRTSGLLAAIALLTLPGIALLVGKPGRALPLYARRYAVPCETCHSTAPRLNAFGLAFQANHYRWPGGDPPAYHTDLKAVPVSGLAIFNHFDGTFGRNDGIKFRTLQLFGSDGFALGGKTRPGGWLVDWFAANADGRAGELDKAFVAVPVAGTHGQWAVSALQFPPMTYQYDRRNSLIQSQPAALANGVDAFSVLEPRPGLRAEFFDGRDRFSPDGTYVSVGVPFEGHLTFNSASRLYSTTHGAYAHIFRRWGEDSVGVFGYVHSGSHLLGALGTKTVGEKLGLLAAISTGRDRFASADNLSLQADYVFLPSLALTARLDSARPEASARHTYPAAAVTWYPFPLKALRVTGETIQAPGTRSVTLYLFGQF